MTFNASGGLVFCGLPLVLRMRIVPFKFKIRELPKIIDIQFSSMAARIKILQRWPSQRQKRKGQIWPESAHICHLPVA